MTRCSTCNRGPLLKVAGLEVCRHPACPGHNRGSRGGAARGIVANGDSRTPSTPARCVYGSGDSRGVS